MSLRIRLFLLFVVALAVALTQTRQLSDVSSKRWYKGNLHTHTVNSDGDSTPHEVATWYREHGYQFLVLSDHNHLTEITGLNAIHAAKEKFLLIPGEEVTDAYNRKPIHVNAYNLAELVAPQHGQSVSATIQNNVDAIRRANAIPSLNHPNFQWAVTAQDLLAVNNLTLFEIYNGHPTVNNRGGGGFQSLDEMWDTLLTAGKRVHGIAVDDAHNFKTIGQQFSNPGRGWICVQTESLTTANITQAINNGQFYASTGPILSNVTATPREYKIEINPRPEEKFTTWFIGENGKTLARSYDTNPTYTFTANDKYVRARVESSFGSTAWTQPAFH